MLLQVEQLLVHGKRLKMKITGLWTASKRGIALLITSIIACAAHAQRINQEGRILGPAPNRDHADPV